MVDMFSNSSFYELTGVSPDKQTDFDTKFTQALANITGVTVAKTAAENAAVAAQTALGSIAAEAASAVDTITVTKNQTIAAIAAAEVSVIDATNMGVLQVTTASSSAANSASTATNAATLAVTARDASVEARDLTTAARDTAVSAKDLAVTAKDQAVTAKTAAEAAVADVTTNAGNLSITATGTSDARPLKDRFADEVNIRDLGAKGDGTTNDTAKVQAALNRAGSVSGGATVVVPPGTYFIDSATLVVPSNVELVGRGGTLKRSSNASIPLLTVEGVSGVCLSNLKIQGTGGNVIGPSVYLRNSTDIEITGCMFVGGMSINCKEGIQRLHVANNTFEGSRSALFLGTIGDGTETLSTDITFVDNIVRNMSDEGVDMNYAVKRMTIAGNVFYNCATSGATGGGDVLDIGGGLHEDIVISGNVLDLAGQAVNGITVKTSDVTGSNPSYTRRTVITGNTISNGGPTDGTGIYCANASQTQITGNIITGMQEGIYCQSGTTDTVISGNSIKARDQAIGLSNGSKVMIMNNDLETTGTAQPCVDIQGGFTLWSVVGNRIRGGSRALIANAASSTGTIADNEVTNALNYGIFCLAPKSSISGNRVYNNGTIGICVQAIDCVVANNLIYNNGTITAGSGAIVLATGSDGAVVTGNRATGTSQSGLRVLGACDRVIVANNQLYGNAGGNTAGTSNLLNSVNINNITA